MVIWKDFQSDQSGHKGPSTKTYNRKRVKQEENKTSTVSCCCERQGIKVGFVEVSLTKWLHLCQLDLPTAPVRNGWLHKHSLGNHWGQSPTPPSAFQCSLKVQSHPGLNVLQAC